MNRLIMKINKKDAHSLLFIILLFLLFFIKVPGIHAATEITLQWDWDKPIDPDTVGYRIYIKELLKVAIDASKG